MAGGLAAGIDVVDADGVAGAVQGSDVHGHVGILHSERRAVKGACAGGVAAVLVAAGDGA